MGIYMCACKCICIYIYRYMHLCMCLYIYVCMYKHFLWLGLTLISTMRRELTLISGVSDLS